MRSSGDDAVIVEILLGRRLLGTFMTIYMPTILLNIISFNTNYLKPIFFEAILTVNLTVCDLVFLRLEKFTFYIC